MTVVPTPPPRGRRVKDARGRKVTQLDPVAMRLLRQHDVIEPDVLRAITRERGVNVSVRERVALIVATAASTLVTILFCIEVATGGILQGPIARTSSLVFFCTMLWVVWSRIKRSRLGHIAAAMLRHERCPHCGYRLGDLPSPDGDGATVCPECGCAWRLPAG